MTEQTAPRAKFHVMTEGTQEDWLAIASHSIAHSKELPARIIAHLQLLKGDFGGFAVDRLEHCLQTATRAHQAGEDEEYVACALVHDIGDTLGPANHADIAAAIVKPYVSERNLFVVEKHGIFQGYYFFHYLGLDRNMREDFRGHPHFEACARFCEVYDQSSFDPAFESMPLEAFESIVGRVFSSMKNSIYLRK
jgi:predicted HD phosphohydrolase